MSDKMKAIDRRLKGAHIIAICADPKSVQEHLNYVRKHGWTGDAYNDLGKAILAILNNRPQFILISFNYKIEKITLLPHLLPDSIRAVCIGFSEKMDAVSLARLSQAKYNYKIQTTLSGPALERSIKRIAINEEERIISEAKPSVEKAFNKMQTGSEDDSAEENFGASEKKSKKNWWENEDTVEYQRVEKKSFWERQEEEHGQVIVKEEKEIDQKEQSLLLQFSKALGGKDSGKNIEKLLTEKKKLIEESDRIRFSAEKDKEKGGINIQKGRGYDSGHKIHEGEKSDSGHKIHKGQKSNLGEKDYINKDGDSRTIQVGGRNTNSKVIQMEREAKENGTGNLGSQVKNSLSIGNRPSGTGKNILSQLGGRKNAKTTEQKELLKKQLKENSKKEVEQVNSSISEAVCEVFESVDAKQETQLFVDRIGVIPVHGEGQQEGYLVVGTTHRLEDKEKLAEFFKLLTKGLLSCGIRPNNYPLEFFETPLFEFNEFSKDQSQLIVAASDGIFDFGFCFIQRNPVVIEVGKFKDPEKKKLEIKHVSTELPVNFDAYLYLEKNQKYFPYLRTGRLLSKAQKLNLEKSYQGQVLVNTEDGDKLSTHVGQDFIHQLIQKFLKIIKKAA